MQKLNELNKVIDYLALTKALSFTEILDTAREWVEKNGGKQNG